MKTYRKADQHIQLFIEKELKEKLRIFAFNKRMTISEIVRKSLENYIIQNENKKGGEKI